MEGGVIFYSPFCLIINILYRYIMEIIEIKTLVDITNTNVRRINQGTQQQLDQFRNWTTLMQTLGMRSIILYDRDPAHELLDVKGMGFGTAYKGTHGVWTFQFRPDRSDAFADGNDVIALLKTDMDKVPVIVKLMETINIQQPVFQLIDDEFRNTVVRAV